MAVVVPRALVFPNVGETRWNNDEAVLGNPFQLSHGKTDASDSFMEGLRKGGGKEGERKKFYRGEYACTFYQARDHCREITKGKVRSHFWIGQFACLLVSFGIVLLCVDV